MADSNTGAMLTASPDGSIPNTRMSNAGATGDFVARLWRNDIERSKKRASVRGLVDGNPPYRQSALKAAGRSEACNVNWGSARGYMESAVGAYYDLAHEANGRVSIRTSHKGPKPDDQDRWSAIMSSKADLLFNDPEEDYDYEEQNSESEMVLHGRGPLFFEDEDCVLPRSIHDGDLKVPERTPATTKRWEVASVDSDYYPPDLYKYISDPEAARKVGWDVEYTQKVIANAMNPEKVSTTAWDFEFYQQELKNNSLSYYDDSRVCPLTHVFWKEFSGRITHAIVHRDGLGGNNAPKYLFFRFERYASFKECIHPMYFDRGNGGFHHSVTGLGVKMFGAMVYENRLMCNLMDKAFAPKTLFAFGTTTSSEKFKMTTLGDYGIIPAGTQVEQAPIQGFLSDGLAMLRTSGDMMRSNLSAYRQQVATKQEGNPATAKQVMLEASQQSALSQTGINRFYQQRDTLYAEIVRRLCNINSTDERAKAFQKACMDEGVPRECFGRIEYVRAIRVVGAGSPFLRKQALNDMAQVVGRLPEEGQSNWLNDYIAAHAGTASVSRYNPQKARKQMADEQDWLLAQAIGLMKQGMAPPVTSEQNPVKFAAGILQAASQSLQSLQQGANPAEVVKFLDLAGPVILAHLKRFANDPTRKPLFKALLGQFKQLAKMTDQIKKKVGQMMQQQKAQQAKTQQAMSDQAIKAMKVKGDLALKAQKQQVTMGLHAAKTRAGIAMQDAMTASQIHRENRRTSALQEV